MNSLERLTDIQLGGLILMAKDGIADAVDGVADGRYEAVDSAPIYHMGLMVLEVYEREAVRRGMNPKDISLGPDWLGASKGE